MLFLAVVSAVLREELSRDTENELLRTHLLFLQAQLRPHFLFNALNTIADVCHNGKAVVAEKLILKLSEFLRHSLDRKEEMATFREEMTFMDAYLEIEKARFGESLKVEKKIDLPDSVLGMKVPLLVFQPLAENAVRHGLRKKQGGGTLSVSAIEKEGCLRVEISDSGAGKPEGFFADLISGKTNEVEGTGIGVRNIHQRLVRAYGRDSGLKYESSPSRGTRVTVCIPVSKEGDKK
jgi:two-component system sensor histidine kinase LytS